MERQRYPRTTKGDAVSPLLLDVVAGRSTRLRQLRKFLAGSVIASLAFSLVLGSARGTHAFVSRSASPKRQEAGETDWDWTQLEPSRTLQWHRCYNDTYDCARLDIPLDWLDPSDDPQDRVALGVIRLRASALDDYKGPLLFNPGGPGGSGVAALINRGALLQAIAGRNYDIVSFDPRGIGTTIPRIECWDSPESGLIWDLQDPGVVDAHPGVIFDNFARATLLAQVCEQHPSSRLLPYVSTASHARDMLEILHQMGYEKLAYWGFSYGTVLGGVFAALYPDKIERLVSDGNVDYREWFTHAHVNFLRDTDKVMLAFFRYCHQVGPSRCDFWAPSPQAIQERLADLLDRIREHPVIVPASESGPSMPQLVTWSRVKRQLSTTLYQPLYMFSNFATAAKALEDGNGEPFYRLSPGNFISSVCSVDGVPSDRPRLEEGNADAFPAILCADSPPADDTLEIFAKFVDGLIDISSSVGDVLALFRTACVGRTIRPKWRFAGPFEGNTSHPILYVANIADNVAPLISARNNSEGFPGSVILVQNVYGHTSLAAPSACTAGYIRAYFQNGTLPAPGTVCEPDYYPFDTLPTTEAGDELSVAYRELSKANWNFQPKP
ncbi:alpha/beta-hydrolase [Durotheca rogersii]|uniref:alpha/beta-hydrolase n=1 Tax=Durotheca rogersii TaxID=419775 RepID=UPI002220262B|nr:alpha/beta-hydrolase [Durotheca rogersii]KAI5860940.1 alpha/beta-hydrolase [Durotheca rogersii]